MVEDVVRSATGKRSVTQAAIKFGIDENKIKRKARNQNSGKPGRKPALSEDFEGKLVEALCVVADWSFPLTSGHFH